jgi:hypothetical protein
MGKTTTIQISRENWQGLNSRKRPGDSFDDVISRLLEGGDGIEKEPAGAECDHCGHTWDYGGSREPGQWITCPACKSSTRL